jgi:hypothetical protein
MEFCVVAVARNQLYRPSSTLWQHEAVFPHLLMAIDEVQRRTGRVISDYGR